jgi:hypothetical protein
VAGTRDVKYLSEFQALQANAPTSIRVSAIRAVSYLNQASTVPWAQQIVLSDAPNEVRTEALRMLGTSVDGLNAILEMAEKGTLPPELTVSQKSTNYSAPPAGAPWRPAVPAMGRRAGRCRPTRRTRFASAP